MNTPILETERLILRKPDATNIETLLEFFGSEYAQFYGGPMTPKDSWEKYAIYVGQWELRGYGLFAILLKEDESTIGMAGPHHPLNFPEPEMSWLLTISKYEGQGFALEACHAVLRHLFEDRSWSSVVSYIDPANSSSLALAKRLGAKLDPKAQSPIPNCDAFRHYSMELVA